MFHSTFVLLLGPTMNPDTQPFYWVYKIQTEEENQCSLKSHNPNLHGRRLDTRLWERINLRKGETVP